VLLVLLIPQGASSQGSDLYTARAIDAINEEKYGPAMEYLEKALAISPDNPEAVYYAGIVASRLGRYGEAETYLLKASRLDETVGEVRYELGRVFFLTSRCDEAAGELSRFLAQAEGGILAEQARGMMADCGKVVEEKSPFTLHLFAGGQYDSNVILEQEFVPHIHQGP
jgi:Flp pilus assembly protein TadD